MPVPNRLYKMAVEHGLTREQIVLDAMEQADGKANSAAELLGVAPNTVHKFLRRNGYKYVNKEWVKPGSSGKEERDGDTRLVADTAARPDKANTSQNECERITASSQS